MISLLKKLLGIQDTDIAGLINQGAVIIDVRSPAEFAGGHAKNSINVPLERIGAKAEELKKHEHIIVCCRSGNRSGMAQRTLKAKGLKSVHNGGSWQNVNSYLN